MKEKIEQLIEKYKKSVKISKELILKNDGLDIEILNLSIAYGEEFILELENLLKTEK
jgi:hypothetical protein